MNCICPYCGQQAVKTDGKDIYPFHSKFHYRTFYKCPGDCDAYVGCHDNGIPLGHPANKPLRDARKLAHTWFDAYWKEACMDRTEGYEWLSKKMGLTEDMCHIGMFDLGQCEKAINVVKEARGMPVQGLLPGMEE